MKKWLIAHRGARCDGRENTLEAITAVKKYQLGYVELDVHSTSDNVVVCHHNFDILGQKIVDHTFKQLKKLDAELITLATAASAVGDTTPLMVEIKSEHTAQKILKPIKAHPHWQIVSFNIEELKYLLQHGIAGERLYLLQHGEPMVHIGRAKNAGLGGIGISYWYLSPIWYWRAKHSGLKMYVYTVNSLLLARLYRLCYPKLNICSDRPDLLQKLN